ncbi:unnamed protein product [Peronospora farinosa]|uniref:Intimal thickness related receptor IRP domain-containing protein n=1 Tax=Peronospora farinosa TaxID=134698 RepID=A0AAV0SRG7_9STRA|nr:unnamed protein product [Peronospora farinosa]CAI5705984.1 unnamed protein product [Peronospora farinosa]
MTRIKIVAIATFWCLSVAVSSASDELLQAINASSLLELQDSIDTVLVWSQYERFLLSKSRTTSFVLYFTPVSICSNENHKDDDEWEESSETAETFTTPQESCGDHEKLVKAAVEVAAETLSPQLPIVRSDIHTWSKLLHYHLVSSTPSLLWIPERSSGRFQRYPHIETNFLDLSANGSLFSKLNRDDADEQHKNFENFQNTTQVDKKIVAKEIIAFVHLCQERSGYLVRNARGMLLPVTQMSRDDDALSGLDMILIVAVLTFIAFIVYENRDFVHGVVCMRFFWFVLCLGVIFVVLSGLFHSIIHRRAWYYFSRMHGFVFVYPSARRQFVLEGLVNGTYSFWLSLAAMSITDVLPTLRSEVARADLIRWSLLLVAISYAALNFVFLIKYRWLA